ncbi:Pycsar system effector family protein [uncultured Cocleimonas sp.]|uniref:Pycsar system effector family protein n=1 Tax=uncultured Cocleimonas sp. TaxID=1051587 RepID=UPI0026391791|nr:Pycsar system effector family protein [uncultured Cocleimonas sp.]
MTESDKTSMVDKTVTTDKVVATDTTSEAKPKLKKKSKNKKTSGSAKGIETMFRNAYRAQLDMLSLAATKANIMISLNGVIVSILMVTGGFIYASTPIFLLPAIVFLITSAISIYFALSAASPAPAPAHTRVLCCFRDVIKGKAKIRDLRNYVKLPEARFNNQSSNILIFEDFATLPRETYLKHMSDLLKDPDEIYRKMSDQLYRLGLEANTKYAMLRYSYSVFRWGLILSILLFLSLKVLQFKYPDSIESGSFSDIPKNSLILDKSTK